MPPFLHLDEGFYTWSRPALIAATVFVISDFACNDSTNVVISDSHYWSEEGDPGAALVVLAVLPPYSIKLFLRKLRYGGGEIPIDSPRRALTARYSEPMLHAREHYVQSAERSTVDGFLDYMGLLLGYSISRLYGYGEGHAHQAFPALCSGGGVEGLLPRQPGMLAAFLLGKGSSRGHAIQHFALDDILEPLYALARATGEEILRYYHSGEEVESEAKADNTPVTEADIAAHHLLMDGLAGFGLPVLSEESAAEASARRDWPTFWMVDPLDGTREFLGRTGEFTINIALIEGHTVSFGLIAVPVGGAVYAGGRDLGAWKRVAENWVPIRCRPLSQAETMVVVASRRHRGEKLDASLAALEQRYPRLRRDHAGSALKFCQLAEGRADFYPRYSPCSEWDTAAGQAIVEGAGGAVLGMDGEPLTYNARDTLLSPHFHALADPGQPIWKLLG